MALTSRDCALEALGSVLKKSQTLDSALSRAKGYCELEPRDRAFAHAITAATIRRLGTIDLIVDTMLDKELPEHAHRARNVLRCGVAELLILKVAPHAVVDSWTSIMGGAKESAKFRGLCNAVLRRVSREGQTLLDEADPLLDLPDWIRGRWIETYGEDIARAMSRVRADQGPLDLTLRSEEDAEEWARRLDGQRLPNGSIRLAPCDVAGLAGYDDGLWWVQDAAASLPVRLLAAKAGERIADACAAPGGKTLQIAASGATTLALDRSENRLRQVHQNLDRTGLSAEVITADATEWTPDQLLDGILLDAPCSATGTVRRNPETLWIKSEADIEKLGALQARLLAHMAGQLKPGGRMVYCTCSLEPEEGEDQIRAFLESHPGYRLDPVRADEVPGLEGEMSREGWLRTRPDLWADRGGLDGFFMARLIRV